MILPSILARIPPRWLVAGLVGLLLAAVWSAAHARRSPAGRVGAAALAQRSEVSQAAVRPEPAGRLAAAVSSAPVIAQADAANWRDPSVDPEVLKRAFAPPSVAVYDRPVSVRLEPPREVWRQRQREDRAVAN